MHTTWEQYNLDMSPVSTGSWSFGGSHIRRCVLGLGSCLLSLPGSWQSHDFLGPCCPSSLVQYIYLSSLVHRATVNVSWLRRSNQSILKEINPEYSLEGLMLKLKLQYFGNLMQRADSLEKTLMLGQIEGRRTRGRQRMRWWEGITDSMAVSLSKLKRWRRTGMPGVLQSMGCQSRLNNKTNIHADISALLWHS